MDNTDARNPNAMTAFTSSERLDEPDKWRTPVDYRIEALRAASRIVAEGVAVMISRTSKDLTIDDKAAASSTTLLAEQFAKWLEAGESDNMVGD